MAFKSICKHAPLHHKELDIKEIEQLVHLSRSIDLETALDLYNGVFICMMESLYEVKTAVKAEYENITTLFWHNSSTPKTGICQYSKFICIQFIMHVMIHAL